jgi:hypothetical protein
MGVEDLHPAHEQDEDTEDIDPVRQPHGKSVTVNQLLAAARPPSGVAWSLRFRRLIHNIDSHDNSQIEDGRLVAQTSIVEHPAG